MTKGNRVGDSRGRRIIETTVAQNPAAKSFVVFLPMEAVKKVGTKANGTCLRGCGP